MQDADDIGRLPPDVLATVLQQLPLKDRLQSASLVCKGWHAASITATRAIARRFSKRSAHLLSEWVRKHGRQAAVTFLELRCPSLVASELGLLGFRDPGDNEIQHLQLPLQLMPELEVLHMHGVQFSRDAEHSTQGAPGTPLLSSPIPKLRFLTLLGYHLPLEGLHLQTKLERLQVVHDRHSSLTEEPDSSFNAVLESALPRLANLSTLLVFSDHLQDDALSHVSTLNRLEALKIGGDKLTTASLLSLPAGLTALQLVTCRNMSINASTAPTVLQLTRLQELHVSLGESVELCPAVLAPLTNLSVLRLHKCSLSSPAQLSVLSGLTKLQHLQLSGALGSDQVAGLSQHPVTSLCWFWVTGSCHQSSAVLCSLLAACCQDWWSSQWVPAFSMMPRRQLSWPALALQSQSLLMQVMQSPQQQQLMQLCYMMTIHQLLVTPWHSCRPWRFWTCPVLP